MPFKKGQIPWNKTNVTTICEFCGKEFRVPPCRLKQSEREKYGRGKYCSKICKDNNRKGKPSWNSGITGKKYKKHYPKGFGGIFYSTKKLFRGNTKEYMALHHWVRKTLGKPSQCSNCKKRYSGKKIQWANKSGNYQKHPSDWIRLCAKCHYKYDRQDKRKTKKLSNA